MRLLFISLFLLSAYLPDSYAKGGGTIPPACTASAPSQATAVSYTKLVTCDTMQTKQTVDLYNTKAAGFNWYMQHCCRGFTITPAAKISHDGTGFNLIGDSSYVGGGYNETLSSITQATNPQGYVGNAWANGFYAEIDLKISATPSNVGWPVMWFATTNRFTNQNQSTCPIGCTFPSQEIDAFEFNDTANAPLTNVYEFTNNVGGSNQGYGNHNNHPTYTGITWTNYNTYGVLWVPSTQNGGTGYIKFYLNNNLISTVTYSPTGVPSPTSCWTPYDGSGPTTCPSGTFSSFDGATFFAMLGTDSTGVTNPTYRNFHVFQLP